jgi:hypothetical protein
MLLAALCSRSNRTHAVPYRRRSVSSNSIAVGRRPARRIPQGAWCAVRRAETGLRRDASSPDGVMPAWRGQFVRCRAVG